jgi:flagellar FliL protein
MSDETKAAKEAKDAKDGKPAAPQAAAAAAPAAAKPAPPVVLIAVVAVALVAGAALGSLLLAPRVIHARQAAAAAQLADPQSQHEKAKKKKDKSTGRKGEEGKPTVYKLDNVIVNPAGSQGQRFLMCTVAIESDDSHALDELRAHEIELRDHVVSLLSKETLDRLTAQNARDSLRADLLKVILPVLGPDGADTELKIYLPQFVVQ